MESNDLFDNLTIQTTAQIDLGSNTTTENAYRVANALNKFFLVINKKKPGYNSSLNTLPLENLGKNEQLIIFYILMTIFLFVFVCLITQLQDCEIYLIAISILKCLCPFFNRPSKLYQTISTAIELENSSSVTTPRCDTSWHQTSSIFTNNSRRAINNHVPSFKNLSGNRKSALEMSNTFSKSRSVMLKEPRLISVNSDMDSINRDTMTIILSEDATNERLSVFKQKKYLEKQLAIY